MKIKFKLHRILECFGWTFWGGAIFAWIMYDRGYPESFQKAALFLGVLSLIQSVASIALSIRYKRQKKERKAKSIRDRLQVTVDKLNSEGHNLTIQ